MRTATINRTTKETDIRLSLALEGAGKAEINTGCGFLNHMLTLFAAHGRFDLSVSCKGDTEVDDHHTVEDVGIALGEAFAEALGGKRGICRYGSCILPMDEALTPGRMMRSARRSASASPVTQAEAPMRARELLSENRLPTP